MVLCSVDAIKAVINTGTLSDEDLDQITKSATDNVLRRANSTDENSPDLILAGQFTAYAFTLRKMKTTGELAANVKTGNDQRQNAPDADIRYYEDQASYHIRKYLNAQQYQNFDGIYGRTGYGTVNRTL